MENAVSKALQHGKSEGTLTRKPTMDPIKPPEPWYSPGENYKYQWSTQTTTRKTASGSSSSKTTRTDIYNIMKSDRTKVRLEIEQSLDKEEARYIATVKPFEQPAPDQLLQFAQSYGPVIVSFAVKNLGKHVGNGECWTLARDALKSAHAAPVAGYNFGAEIEIDQAMPGDILQFTAARFEMGNSWKVVGRPNHTAIVHSKLGLKKLKVLEQNPGPVGYSEYDFACMTEGSVQIYRPIAPEEEPILLHQIRPAKEKKSQ